MDQKVAAGEMKLIEHIPFETDAGVASRSRARARKGEGGNAAISRKRR